MSSTLTAVTSCCLQFVASPPVPFLMTCGAWAAAPLAGAVSQGSIRLHGRIFWSTAVVTMGRRTDESAELHIPEGADVELVETNRGGKSTFHGPGQLVCYPILDLKRHGRDVKQYVRNLEEALIRTVEPFGVEGRRIDG